VPDGAGGLFVRARRRLPFFVHRADRRPGGNFDCAGVAQGTCSPASITVGCWCFFDDTGTPTGLCVD
jgi:hypothetical protein